MLEKPAISDETIIACLGENFGLSVDKVEFLPLGYDVNAGVYRVTALRGGDYFLKVKKGRVDTAALTVPRYFRECGIEAVIAPLPAKDGRLWAMADDYTLILYPYIDGADGMQQELTPDQWIHLGEVLRQIHSVKLPPDMEATVAREDFSPMFRTQVREFSTILETAAFDDRHKQQFAAFWNGQRRMIDFLVDRAEALAELRVNRPTDEWCLCHSDIHVANILLSRQGELFIVDWDQPVIAPKERDLMFVGGGCAGLVSEGEEDYFYQGYGQTGMDWETFAYYRYERIVQDLAAFGEEVLVTPDTSEVHKDQAVRTIMRQFRRGAVIDIACRSERRLPAALSVNPPEIVV